MPQSSRTNIKRIYILDKSYVGALILPDLACYAPAPVEKSSKTRAIKPENS
jgi:hypothetical protein